MPKSKKITFSLSPSGEVAYLKLPISANDERKVARNIRIHELISGFKGPDVIFDFDKEGRLLGIEILLE